MKPLLTSGSTISKSLEGAGSDANPALSWAFISSYEETMYNNKQHYLTCNPHWYNAAFVKQSDAKRSWVTPVLAVKLSLLYQLVVLYILLIMYIHCMYNAYHHTCVEVVLSYLRESEKPFVTCLQ